MWIPQSTFDEKTHMPSRYTELRISPYVFNSQNQLAASVCFNQETALWDSMTTWVYKTCSSGAGPTGVQSHLSMLQRVSITIEWRQEGKQQNKHCIYYICSGRRNVPIACPVWQLRFRKCKQGVLFWTISHQKRNPCSAVHSLPSTALSGSLCHRSSPGG